MKIYLGLITYDELCACQITEFLKIKGATASRHLNILISAKLIKSRKDGRWVYYSLNESNEEILKLVKAKVKADKEAELWLNELKTIVNENKESICRKQRGITCCPNKK